MCTIRTSYIPACHFWQFMGLQHNWWRNCPCKSVSNSKNKLAHELKLYTWSLAEWQLTPLLNTKGCAQCLGELLTSSLTTRPHLILQISKESGDDFNWLLWLPLCVLSESPKIQSSTFSFLNWLWSVNIQWVYHKNLNNTITRSCTQYRKPKSFNQIPQTMQI